MLNLLTLVIVSFVIVGLALMGLTVAIALFVNVVGEIRATITSNKAAKAATKESAMPVKIVTTLVALFAIFPVSAFAATTTAMEPVMTIPVHYLHIGYFFACTFAALAFLKEFMLNRKIKALTAELKIANRRADKAETGLEEANACFSTSTANAEITKLQADNAQLVEQTTWLSTLANNLSKIVAGTVTTLVCLFFAMPAHAAAPWAFAADAGQLPDMIACACLAAMAFAGVTAIVLVADLLIRKIILAITNITTKAISAITMENAMPVLTLAFIAIFGLIVALFPSCAGAATSITMNNDGLTINVMDSAVLSYLAWIVGASLTAIIGAILCEILVRLTRTICMMPGRKAAAAAKKAEMLLIIRTADQACEDARLDTWYDRAEYESSLSQLSHDARVAVLRGKPYWTNQSVTSAANKACGYRRAVLTR